MKMFIIYIPSANDDPSHEILGLYSSKEKLIELNPELEIEWYRNGAYYPDVGAVRNRPNRYIRECSVDEPMAVPLGSRTYAWFEEQSKKNRA